ncbi:MAG: DUF1343 domain-containing protein [Eubacteriales bacterium]|nr:DUF1343 domain-containing protein [Eubacteriales bacterium]
MSKLHVLSGIDRQELYHSSLNGKRIGLMTNQTGIDRSFRQSVDILHKNYRLTSLLAVEHGVRGDVQAGEKVSNFLDPKTQVPVYSLYGDSKRPSEEIMRNLDVVVYDMQDVGARFYTYLYSLSYLMEACAKYNVPLVIFDRINPLGGEKVEGILLENEVHSFVGEHPMPARYGLTVGEYSLYIRKILGLDIDLTIIPLDGWRRNIYLDEVDLPWVAPSPNCPTLNAMQCFVGTCIFEGTNVSEGRGTTLPFENIGAPWIDSDELSKRMKKFKLSGVHFRPCSFVPTFSKHQGKICYGVQLHVTDRNTANVFAAGLYLLDTIKSLYPDHFEFLKPTSGDIYFFDRLLGSTKYREGLLNADAIVQLQQKSKEEFEQITDSIKLYQ